MRVQESCGQEWESVMEMFSVALEIEGTAFIDCENTGKHLSPLPHDCVALEHLCEFCTGSTVWYNAGYVIQLYLLYQLMAMRRVLFY